MIEIRDLGKTYINNKSLIVGVEHISACFNVNEFIMISGESGSGKSTLLKIIAGKEMTTSGRMIVDSKDTEYFGENDWVQYRRDKIAIVYQDFELIEDISVYKNIELAYVLNHDCDNKEYENEIKAIISRTGLSEQSRRRVSTLSGGQKQRVAIARALAKDTPIILADEPTGNLDSHASKEIANLLKEISQDKLIIVVTHNEEYFEKVATRHLIMSRGTIVSDSLIKAQSLEESSPYQKLSVKEINHKNEVSSLLKSIFFSNRKNDVSFSITIFSVMIIVLLLFSVMLQVFSNNDEGIMYTPIFGGVEKERLIIRNDNGTAFTNEQINALRADERFSYIVENDIILDIMFEIDFKYDYGTVRNQYYSNIIESGKVISNNLLWGRLPESDDEVLLSSDGTVQILDENMRDVLISAVHNPLKTKKVKIVGEFIDIEKDQQTIYFTKKAAHQISYEFSDKYSDIEITNLSNGYVGSQQISVFTNDSAKSDTLYISLELARKIDLSVDNQGILIKNQTPYFTKTCELKSEIIILSADNNPFTEYIIGNDDDIIVLSPNDFSKIFSNDIYQVSVYMKNPSIFNSIIEDMENNGFLAYYPYAVNQTPIDSSTVITQVVIFLLSIVLAIVLIVLSLLLIKKKLKKENLKYEIILALGYDKKSIKIISLIKNAVIILFAIFLCGAIYVAINIIKKTFASKFLHSFVPLTNIPVYYFVLLCAVIGVIYLYSLFKRVSKIGNKTISR